MQKSSKYLQNRHKREAAKYESESKASLCNVYFCSFVDVVVMFVSFGSSFSFCRRVCFSSFVAVAAVVAVSAVLLAIANTGGCNVSCSSNVCFSSIVAVSAVLLAIANTGGCP